MPTLRRFVAYGAAYMLACAAAIAKEPPPLPLRWDASSKVFEAKPGDPSATVAFEARNTGSSEIVINRVETSCGCTTAILPAKPWRLAPGAAGVLRLRIDLIGKSGTLHKTATIHSTVGEQRLGLTLIVPPMPEQMRAVNHALAEQNRQAVFAGGCTRCHATPTVGKQGAALFVAACAICHLADPRASSVPDITQAHVPRDAAYWRHVVEDGRPGTLMPAFAAAEGGPLDEAQVTSLVAFLLRQFPTTTTPHGGS